MDFSQKITLSKLLRYTMPTMVMMVFSSMYSTVDGIFVSRYAGGDALSAINVVYPLIFIVIGIGVMLSTGGSAVVARYMGEGKERKAMEIFTLLLCVTAGIGVALAAVSIAFMGPIVRMLGASQRLYDYCVAYGIIIMAFSSVAMLQLLFQMFFVTAGKPNTGLWLTVISGISNVVFDYIFIAKMGMGIEGAALGTVISYAIGGILPFFFFFKGKGMTLHLVKPKWYGRALVNSMANGASEMVSNIAASITTLLFNLTMMKLLGEEGINAITIVLYTQFLFTSMFIGFSNGVAPILSYNYGSGNKEQLRRLLKLCSLIVLLGSAAMVIIAQVLAEPTIRLFADKGSMVYTISLEGYRIFAWNFLIAGINIFVSSFFTALSNGAGSAIVSFLRVFAFQVLAILFLPEILGTLGVWLAIPIAEGATFFIAMYLLKRYNKVYGYLPAHFLKVT